MKKGILGLSVLSLTVAGIFVACKKDSIKENTPINKQETKAGALAKNYTSFLRLFNVNITINWKDGCYSATTEYYPNGGIKSQTISCSPGCKFCMVTGTATVVALTGSPDNGRGPLGFDVPFSADQSNYYGVLSKDSVNNTLIFAIDKSKISDAIYQDKFAGNTIDLSSGFAIDESSFQMLGIDRAHQFVPAGNYPLYREGNIVYFEYSLN